MEGLVAESAVASAEAPVASQDAAAVLQAVGLVAPPAAPAEHLAVAGVAGGAAAAGGGGGVGRKRGTKGTDKAAAGAPSAATAALDSAEAASLAAAPEGPKQPMELKHERLVGYVWKYVAGQTFGFVKSHLFEGEVFFRCERIMPEFQGHPICEGEHVEFDVQSDDHGRPHAVQMKPVLGRKANECLGQRHRGYVRRFAERWGFLNAAAFDGDLFVHRDNLLPVPDQLSPTDGQPALRSGQAVEFDVALDDRGRAVAKQITTRALLRPCDWIGHRLRGYIRSFQGAWGFINSDRFAGDLFVHRDSLLAKDAAELQGIQLAVGTIVEFDVERDHHRKGTKNRLVARHVGILGPGDAGVAVAPQPQSPDHATYAALPAAAGAPLGVAQAVPPPLPGSPMQALPVAAGVPLGAAQAVPSPLPGSPMQPGLPLDPALYAAAAQGANLGLPDPPQLGLAGYGMPSPYQYPQYQLPQPQYPLQPPVLGAPQAGQAQLAPLATAGQPYPPYGPLPQPFGTGGMQVLPYQQLPAQQLSAGGGGVPPPWGQQLPGQLPLGQLPIGQPSPAGGSGVPPPWGQQLPAQPPLGQLPLGQPPPQPGLGATVLPLGTTAPQPQDKATTQLAAASAPAPAAPATPGIAEAAVPMAADGQNQGLLHITMHDWEPDQPGQLWVTKGTLVNVSYRAAHGWVYAGTVQPGSESGEPASEGWIPQAVVKRVSLCRVAVDWPTEGNQTLGVSKGEIIAVSKEADRGWVYGERIGPKQPDRPSDGWLPKKVLEYLQS